MTTTHTPGPWIATQAFYEGWPRDTYCVETANHICVCHKVKEVDAAFIVRACNSHADLLAALKQIKHTLAHGRNVGENIVTAAIEAEDIARAAIASMEIKS